MVQLFAKIRDGEKWEYCADAKTVAADSISRSYTEAQGRKSVVQTASIGGTWKESGGGGLKKNGYQDFIKRLEVFSGCVSIQL